MSNTNYQRIENIVFSVPKISTDYAPKSSRTVHHVLLLCKTGIDIDLDLATVE
jgi:hypothetical protein